MFGWFRSVAYLARRAAAVCDDLETAQENNLFKTDPDRFLALKRARARRFSVQPRRDRTCPPFLSPDKEELQRGIPQQQGGERHAG